ncbi:MAG TPA: glycosyl hydrolase family 18 protein [Bacteroidales bacterium]|nr:glycosyl hydrolase family 18 protein [Bacteroidales bacterium]HSA42254.1 glycosyl hydrolase family 18 protein [Bacteroidales bacterium]
MKHLYPFTFLTLLLCLLAGRLFSQFPHPALTGYWHNWNDFNAPYIPLDQVDSRYNVMAVAFAVPETGSNHKMTFIPDGISQAAFITQIQAQQAQGKKVLISIGGATAPVILNNAADRDTFSARMLDIINTYGFDGIDIDLEGGSLSVSAGSTIAMPVDPPLVNLIQAIRDIMQLYHQQHQKKMLLSMAPETAYVQGGFVVFQGIWGAYLPLIDALRDSLDVLHVQLYNSGSMQALDGNLYNQGTADFIVSMTEMLIQGFQTSGGYFQGLPASRVAVGLPACPSAAGGGFTDTATVAAAVRYLMNTGPNPGTYQRISPTGYPDLAGMMTWSINWDATPACGTTWEYAANYQALFGTSTGIYPEPDGNSRLQLWPNPASTSLHIRCPDAASEAGHPEIYDLSGKCIRFLPGDKEAMEIDITALEEGIYLFRYGSLNRKFLVIK